MIIDGKLVCKELKEKYRKIISKIPGTLKLVVVLVGDNPASEIYVSKKEKICKEMGVDFELVRFDSKVKENVLIDKITSLNNDPKVTGILVQLPLPKHIDEYNVINSISYYKDVDGITVYNMGNLLYNKNSIIPGTPKGILELLKYYKIPLVGASVVIVGRSNIVGRPLSVLLTNADATVTLCHSKTKNLVEYTKKADILIVAVGKKHFINREMIKKDAVIIDVGINRVDGHVYGDVDFNDVIKKVSYITPVPGGVGVMTVLMIMDNLIKCYALMDKIND